MTAKELIACWSGEYAENLVRHRRHLHRHPEVAFNEKETQAYVLDALKAAGVSCQTIPGCYCVIGSLEGGRPGKHVAFRSDMDALPMKEENTGDLVSQNPGVMHACGHDGHTAILLTLAETLAAHRDMLSGKVTFLFQHAEEVLPGGARTICENGFLDDVDLVFGGHIWPTLNVGEVAVSEGPVMAAADGFSVELRGVGGHGSQPDRNQDVVTAACALVQAFNMIVSRSVNASETAVLSVCHVEAGKAFNVMPDTAVVEGTVRTFHENSQEVVIGKIQDCVAAVEKQFGIKAKLTYTRGYPAVVNAPEAVALAKEAVTELTDRKVIPQIASMVGEDFSYYQRKTCGAFFYFGSRNVEKGISTVLHSSTYQMDEDVLNAGLETYLACLSKVGSLA